MFDAHRFKCFNPAFSCHIQPGIQLLAVSHLVIYTEYRSQVKISAGGHITCVVHSRTTEHIVVPLVHTHYKVR
jgi:hypothetical protein